MGESFAIWGRALVGIEERWGKFSGRTSMKVGIGGRVSF